MFPTLIHFPGLSHLNMKRGRSCVLVFWCQNTYPPPRHTVCVGNDLCMLSLARLCSQLLPKRDFVGPFPFHISGVLQPKLLPALPIQSQEAMRSGDLALIRLYGRLPGVAFGISILPVDPLSSTEDQYQHAYAVGFGEGINRWRPGDKAYASVDLEGRICTRNQFLQYGCVEGREIMASRPPHDTCYGDSGGPLYIQQFPGDPMKLIGITSRAKRANPDALCGPGGIYTSLEVSEVRNWLRTTYRPYPIRRRQPWP